MLTYSIKIYENVLNTGTHAYLVHTELEADEKHIYIYLENDLVKDTNLYERAEKFSQKDLESNKIFRL